MRPARLLLTVLVLSVNLLFIGYRYARLQQRTEPDPSKRAGWIQLAESIGVLPESPLLAPSEKGEELLEVRERPPRSHAPRAAALTHPFAKTIREALVEAELSRAQVLDVACDEDPCIVTGIGTTDANDVQRLFATAAFRTAYPDVGAQARSAVHWPSDWEDEEAFFAIAVHPRDEQLDARRARFQERVRALRTAHETGE